MEGAAGSEDAAAWLQALGGCVYRYSLSDAIRDGVLTPYRCRNIAIPMLAAEDKRYRELTKRIAQRTRRIGSSDIASDQALRRLLVMRARVASLAQLRVPAALNVLAGLRGRRGIVFHESVAHAERIYRHMQSLGHSVTLYHSQMGGALRRDNLRLFRAGVFDIMVTCRALDEGIDVPDATFALIASGTASSRQRIQRVGRILRLAAGKKVADIITLYSTEPERRRLLEEASDPARIDAVEWVRMSRRNV
jgi:superfamily II DNA or RNA helicase